MKVSLITPTYNEKENIEKLLTRLSKLNIGDFEIVVVDDNSPDGTAEEVNRLAKLLPLKIKLLKRIGQRDLSLSVLDGFKEASGEILGVMDADLSHPPEIIPTILEELKNANLVVASRKASGSEIKNWPFRRKLNAWVAKFLGQTLTRRVSDPMSGFFFFKKEIIDKIKLKPLGYKILLEILVKGNCQKVEEIPFIFEDRKGGKSKLNWRIILKFLLHICKLHWWKIKNKKI